ncbi:MAG: GlmU family protein [Chitinophagales bacterium]|nr:GlmU family protein [Chitinophagales bacterium]
MNFILSDHYEDWIRLNPLTLTKSISSLRIGITSIKEKWDRLLPSKTQIKTCQSYLNWQNDFSLIPGEQNVFINSSYIPNAPLVARILELHDGESLYQKGQLIASKLTIGKTSFEKELEYPNELIKINNPWDLFQYNDKVLKQDFELLTSGRKSAKLSSSNRVIGDEKLIFLEENAKVEASILNTNSGPIYLGKNAEIMEGSMVRGSLALCEGASLKLGTKIYGACTIGPYSKIGGELNNSLIQAYSNKGHDGFLGNSVIGEWCNLGADTNNSNLKNNYGEVKMYSYATKNFVNSKLQFLGLIMGDHSKCGINTMFNTGTVVGVFANIFGSNFPPKYIPSFSWGGAAGFVPFELEKAKEVAERVMERRGLKLSKEEESVIEYLYQSKEE